jgi:hypothetical protein
MADRGLVHQLPLIDDVFSLTSSSLCVMIHKRVSHVITFSADLLAEFYIFNVIIGLPMSP